MKFSLDTEDDWNAGQAVEPWSEMQAAIVTGADDSNVESTRPRMLGTAGPLLLRILFDLGMLAMYLLLLSGRFRGTVVIKSSQRGLRDLVESPG